MIEKINFYVSPAEGVPLWWNADHGDGLSTGVPFEAAEGISMPDDVRFAAYRLAYGETSSHWRQGTEQEARLALFQMSLSWS